jgi:aerobic-type carbon monoxide dehydrogenase small subunit (CoxS/CutS family)
LSHLRELSRSERDEVVDAVTTIVDTYSPPMPVLACYARLKSVNGYRVITVEGIAEGGPNLHPLQEAFLRQHAFQCGFSTPGFLMAGYILIKELEHRPVYKDRIDDIVLQAIGDHVCRCTGYHRYFHAIREVIHRMDEEARAEAKRDKPAKAESETCGDRRKSQPRPRRLFKERPKDYAAQHSSTITFKITKKSDNDEMDKMFIGSFENARGEAYFSGSLDWANCRMLRVWAPIDSLRTGIRVRDLNLRYYFFRTATNVIPEAAEKAGRGAYDRQLGPGDLVMEDTEQPGDDQSKIQFELRHAHEVDERLLTAAAPMGTPVPVHFHGDLVFAGKRIDVKTEMLVCVLSKKMMRIMSQSPLRIDPRDLGFSIEAFHKEFGVKLGAHAEVNCDIKFEYRIETLTPKAPHVGQAFPPDSPAPSGSPG